MSTPLSEPIPTVADVDRIAALTDPVLRNLQITQSYHELARVMSARAAGANWCTFAAWASKQAGQTIRKEDLRRLLETALLTAQSRHEVAAAAQALGSPRTEGEIQRAVGQALNPQAAIDRASDAVARGNRKVYAEIGREFARFYAACLRDGIYDEPNIAIFCDALRPGEPPEGQRYLRQAFTRYYQSFFAAEGKTRAELMLLANVEIGLHEQTRLQPEIEEAMNAAFAGRPALRLRLALAIFPLRGLLLWLHMLVLRLVGRRSRFGALLDRLVDDARSRVRLCITEAMMSIEFPPGVRLRLGEDVPGEFPVSLRQLELPELTDRLSRIDPTPDSPHGSGARDWSRLPDRLHFIADLFRRYHESVELFDPPFSEAQVQDLKADRLPSGRL